jgi:hypothetical protein
MADAPVFHMGENSPEGVAHKLFIKLQSIDQPPNGKRDWLLDLYAECLLAVKHPESRKKRGSQD